MRQSVRKIIAGYNTILKKSEIYMKKIFTKNKEKKMIFFGGIAVNRHKY